MFTIFLEIWDEKIKPVENVQMAGNIWWKHWVYPILCYSDHPWSRAVQEVEVGTAAPLYTGSPAALQQL